MFKPCTYHPPLWEQAHAVVVGEVLAVVVEDSLQAVRDAVHVPADRI